MDYDNFINKVSMYIDGKLSQSEKIEFKEAISDNKEWSDLYLDIKRNDELLKNLPKITTDPNFIVKLNEKIDLYDQKKNFLTFSSIKDFVFNLKPIPALSIFSLVILLSFSILKLNNFSLFPDLSQNNLKNEDNYIAINDADSLKADKDSLNNPILLIGNGR